MNKHKFYVTIGLLTSMYSCSEMKQGNEQRPSNQPDSVTINVTVDTSANELKFATEKISLKQVNKGAETNIEIDYPISGKKELISSIYAYLNDDIKNYYETTEMDDPIKNYEGDFEDKGAFLKHYTFEIQKFLKSWNNADESVGNYYADDILTKEYETEKFVSYVHKHTIYTGGAHGLCYEIGTTFWKENGKKFSWDLMKNTDSDEFRKVLKEGMRQYFEEVEEEKINDEELDNHFFNGDASNLPLPKNQPYFTDKGIEIGYNRYEVTGYALGSPKFTLSYSDAKKFLKEEAIEMLK